MGFLLLVTLAALAGAHVHHDHGNLHHGHPADHDHAERVAVHDSHHHATGGWLASLEWLGEWILIGAITVLVLYIGRMLVFGGAAPRGPLPPRAAAAPQRKAAQIFLTPDELARFNGADKSLPVYVAIRGTIFDVSPRRDMYGTVGQGYNCLAGRDASRALAKHALDEATCRNSKIDDLTRGELEALDQWEGSFRQKYNAVGQVVHSAEDKQSKTAEEDKRYAAETQRLATPAAAGNATGSKL